MIALKALIATELNVPVASVLDTTTMEETPAWDSLAHMDVILSIEKHYDINLEGDDIADMLSVAAIAGILKQKGVSFV